VLNHKDNDKLPILTKFTNLDKLNESFDLNENCAKNKQLSTLIEIYQIESNDFQLHPHSFS
jgi:hypothetical protein